MEAYQKPQIPDFMSEGQDPATEAAVNQSTGGAQRISDLISSQLAGVDSYLELKRREYGSLSDSDNDEAEGDSQPIEPPKPETEEI
jgi:hypothetical protein